MINRSRHHEQKIGKPIQVFDYVRTNFNFLRQTYDAPLGAAANRSSHVQHPTGMSSAGQDKLTKRRQLGLKTVNGIFQRRNPLA